MAPQDLSPESLVAALTGLAGGTAPTIDVNAHLLIVGVELTQSTQFNSAATSFHGDDNSVPLVGWKTLAARVYATVRKGFLGADGLSGRAITGELSIWRGSRLMYSTGPTREGGVRVGPERNIDRTSWDDEKTLLAPGSDRFTLTRIEFNTPLNFMVPAYWLRPGRCTVTVRVWPADEDARSVHATVHSENVQLLDVPAPKIALVRVNWTDANGNVTSPSAETMLGTLSVADRMLPFPYFDATILGIESSQSGDFGVPATGGGCNARWSAISTDMALVGIFTALFQLGDLVYAVVPAAANLQTGPSNTGCWTGSGGGFAGDGVSFAHEMGHAFGRRHVAVPGDTNNDTNYPSYSGSRRSIGEVGIDTGSSPVQAYDPASTVDLMAYANSGEAQWISPYTYQGILDARSLHQSAAVRPSALRPWLVLKLRVHRPVDGRSSIDVLSQTRVLAAGSAPVHSGRPAYSLDLLDHDGQVLVTHHCAVRNPVGCGCGGCGDGGEVSWAREPWVDLVEAVPLPPEDEVRSIAVRGAAEPVATLTVGEAPTVRVSSVEVGDATVTFEVAAEHPRERPSVGILLTADDAKTWQLVALHPEGDRVTLRRDALPGGRACRIRAIATAELASATADSETFELPERGRTLWVQGAPGKPCRGQSVALSAQLDNGGLGPVEPGEIVWTSDLDGELGRGYSVRAALTPGRHAVEASAPDGIGGRATSVCIIIVSG